MPMLIHHIDAIARQKGRDVVFVTFPECDSWLGESPIDYAQCAARDVVITWLDGNRIGWLPCAKFADENFIGAYTGDVYVDVPFDPGNEAYRQVKEFLEYPDGTSKIEGARFSYLPLAIAMTNSHHDKPGFWEEWAKAR